MRQTLFYLPTEIFGLPLFGKGILFWTILVAGLVAIVRGLVQKRRLDDAIFYACITGLGLFVVNVVGPHISEAQGFPIRGYGVFLTLAIVLSGALVIWRGRKKWNYPADILIAIIFFAAFCGIIGARVFYVLQYWGDMKGATARQTLVSVLDITNGGLVVYGSIIGGTIAVLGFLLVKKLPVLATLDLFAPSLMLGIAIGRIGCLMNGCCFGGVCDKPWAIVFPKDSPAYMHQVDEGVISLYGITLAPPPAEGQAANGKAIFGIKSEHTTLATETVANVIVGAVDPGSEAEAAGIKPGMRVCEMGIAPKGFLEARNNPQADGKPAKIRKFRPNSNAQFFHFFLYMWNGDPDTDVYLAVQEPAAEEKIEDVNGKKAVEARIREFVYHPSPATAKPVHPTQLYSSTTALTICVLLLALARFVKKDGIVFAAMLILYPINRFCLELLRTDEASFHGTGLTVSQCVSVCALVLGVAIMLYALRGPGKSALEGYFPASAQAPDAEK
ncbi:MAG: prolipoprotein diacylglyceryl transferase [Thermoguttaceae bacterium]|nr:prolipoprotein diacylglyceryl transferase [Thermoguttaceae bacterium]